MFCDGTQLFHLNFFMKSLFYGLHSHAFCNTDGLCIATEKKDFTCVSHTKLKVSYLSGFGLFFPILPELIITFL